MILSKNKILEEKDRSNIILDGVADAQIKDQSVDVSLGDWICVDGMWWDLSYDDYYARPGEFIIAHTDEFIGTAPGSNILPSFKLKSSAGRHGIIHTLAGHGECGYFNRWAMEFIVAKPITLKKGMLIGQIYFTRTEGAENEDYSKTGTYQKTNNLEELKNNWKKEDLLPPPLKIKTVI